MLLLIPRPLPGSSALLVFTPLVTSSLLTASFIHPVLDKALQNKEAFPLSGMQEIEGAHEVRAS